MKDFSSSIISSKEGALDSEILMFDFSGCKTGSLISSGKHPQEERIIVLVGKKVMSGTSFLSIKLIAISSALKTISYRGCKIVDMGGVQILSPQYYQIPLL